MIKAIGWNDTRRMDSLYYGKVREKSNEMIKLFQCLMRLSFLDRVGGSMTQNPFIQWPELLRGLFSYFDVKTWSWMGHSEFTSDTWIVDTFRCIPFSAILNYRRHQWIFHPDGDTRRHDETFRLDANHLRTKQQISDAPLIFFMILSIQSFESFLLSF